MLPARLQSRPDGGAEGRKGAIAPRTEILGAGRGSRLDARQFDIRRIRGAYRRQAEIWQDSDGKIDILVSVSVRRTILGAGRYLRERKTTCTLPAVEPNESPVSRW